MRLHPVSDALSLTGFCFDRVCFSLREERAWSVVLSERTSQRYCGFRPLFHLVSGLPETGSPVRGHSGQRHSGLRQLFQKGQCDVHQHTPLHLVMTPIVRFVSDLENRERFPLKANLAEVVGAFRRGDAQSKMCRCFPRKSCSANRRDSRCRSDLLSSLEGADRRLPIVLFPSVAI